MRVKLAYGREGLWVNLPYQNVTVMEPSFVAGLDDERSAIIQALRQPLGNPPLRELVTPEDTVAIVFSDLTRPTPNDRLMPPLLAELNRQWKRTVIIATHSNLADSLATVKVHLRDGMITDYQCER